VGWGVVPENVSHAIAFQALIQTADVLDDEGLRTFAYEACLEPLGRFELADDHVALVTSANLTDRAVSDNLEVGVLVQGGDVPRRLAAHFSELVASGVLTRG
jgi:hypothetical protein